MSETPTKTGRYRKQPDCASRSHGGLYVTEHAEYFQHLMEYGCDLEPEHEAEPPGGWITPAEYFGAFEERRRRERAAGTPEPKSGADLGSVGVSRPHRSSEGR